MARLATCTVEIGFSSDPGTDLASTTWTDVTADVRVVSIRRGRQRALDQFAAGTCSVTLNNRTRRYDPQYTGAGAPYNGNILPMRRIRVRAVYNAVTYDLFSGYIDGWQQVYDPPRDAVAEVTATDAFKVLNNTELLSSSYAEEVDADGPVFWWRLGDSTNTNAAVDQVGGTLRLDPIGTPGFGAESLTINEPDEAVSFPTVNDGLQGVFAAGIWPFDDEATVEFLYRYGGTFADPIMVAFVLLAPVLRGWEVALQNLADRIEILGYNNAGTPFSAQTVNDTGITDGAAHHVSVVWKAGDQILIYIDGADVTDPVSDTFTGSMADATNPMMVAVNAVDRPPYAGPGQIATHDELALYATALSPARIAAHHEAATTAWRGDTSGERLGRLLDAIDWPAADRDIDTGLSTLQSATLNTDTLQAAQLVETTEQALLFINTAGQVRFVDRTSLNSAPYTTSQATFGDSAAELKYQDVEFTYNDQLIYNDIRVSRAGGVVKQAQDAASQVTFLRRTQTLDGLLHDSDSESFDLANYRLLIYKDPLDRVTGLTVAPERSPATLYPQALGRELGDRITIKRRPQGVGSAISQDANVEGITHTITPDSWVTAWNLSPANTLQFWVAGIAGASEAGQTTRGRVLSYSAPTTITTGQLVTASLMNTDWAGNIAFLANPPSCRVYNNANISIAEVTTVALTFNSERWDTDSMHSTVSNTSRITFNTAGLYVVTASISMEANSDYDIVNLHLRMNGSTFIALNAMGALDTNEGPCLTTTSHYKFAAADYVEAIVYHNNGANAARNCLAAANYSPEFGATWIGLG